MSIICNIMTTTQCERQEVIPAWLVISENNPDGECPSFYNNMFDESWLDALDRNNPWECGKVVGP